MLNVHVTLTSNHQEIFDNISIFYPDPFDSYENLVTIRFCIPSYDACMLLSYQPYI